MLSPMTKEEADKAGLESHVNHFRVEVGKSNLARPMDKAMWFEKKSHALDNGDSCAVQRSGNFLMRLVECLWSWVRRIQRRIESERPKHSPKAENWAGKIIIEVLELDIRIAISWRGVRLVRYSRSGYGLGLWRCMKTMMEDREG